MGDLRSVVAGNIRALRARAQLRQVDLAAALHLSQPSMSDLEKGRRDVTLPEAVAICTATGATLPELLNGADPEVLALLAH